MTPTIRRNVDRVSLAFDDLMPLKLELERAHDAKDPERIQDAFDAVMEAASRMCTAAAEGFGDAAILRARKKDEEFVARERPGMIGERWAS